MLKRSIFVGQYENCLRNAKTGAFVYIDDVDIYVFMHPLIRIDLIRVKGFSVRVLIPISDLINGINLVYNDVHSKRI